MKLLFNRNVVKFHQHNATLQTRTKLVQFGWDVRRIHLILHFQISTFYLYEIFLIERTSFLSVKPPETSSSFENAKFWNDVIMKPLQRQQSLVKQNGTCAVGKKKRCTDI